jgi:hypothetical protein
MLQLHLLKLFFQKRQLLLLGAPFSHHLLLLNLQAALLVL